MMLMESEVGHLVGLGERGHLDRPKLEIVSAACLPIWLLFLDVGTASEALVRPLCRVTQSDTIQFEPVGEAGAVDGDEAKCG